MFYCNWFAVLFFRPVMKIVNPRIVRDNASLSYAGTMPGNSYVEMQRNRLFDWRVYR